MSKGGKRSLSPRSPPNNHLFKGCLSLSLSSSSYPRTFSSSDAGFPSLLAPAPPASAPSSVPRPSRPRPAGSPPLTCARRCPGARLPRRRPPARGAPGRRRLLRQCQPRSQAWVWDRAARGTRAAQGRAGREGGGRGAGTRAGTALSPRAPDRLCREGTRGAPGTEGVVPGTQPPLPGPGELTAQPPLPSLLRTRTHQLPGLCATWNRAPPSGPALLARPLRGARVMRHKCEAGRRGRRW